MNFLVVGLLIAAPVAKVAAEPPSPPLVGVWKLVEEIRDGQPQRLTADTTIEFTSTGRQLLREGSKHDDIWNYRLAGAGVVELCPPRDHEKSGICAIYKIDKDTLVLCYSVNGVKPSQFESPPKSGLILQTLSRVRE